MWYNMGMSWHKHNNVKGFTIVELLIVIVIIAILAAITIVSYTGIQNRARDAQLQSTVALWVKALKLHQANVGSYPIDTEMIDPLWTKSNMTGVTTNMYYLPATGDNKIIISRDPVTASLNNSTDYFKTGYINYRGSSAYWLKADGSFDDNNTTCSHEASCPTYVLVYRTSDGKLHYQYGS